jgi:hypothetical protein
MIDKQKLCKFLVMAKKSTYASGEKANKIVENDGSTTLIFEDGNFKYHDNYFGGEPFGGREIVSLNNEPIYIMTYYGSVDESIADFEAIYNVLQKALSLIPEDHPFRGPKEYLDNNLIYKNSYTGEVDNFFGEETINTVDGKEIYRTRYAGGLICQRT